MPPSRHGRQRGYHIVFSSGVYFLTREDANLKAAVDRAHYAKDLSKGSYSSMVTVYSEQIKQVIADEKEIEGMMGDALKNGEFQPYFQAKVDVVTRKIVGAEALTRWIHPEKGIIPPGKFIPFFEKNGFVVRLDRYIFEEVCRLIRQWLDMGIDVPPISCNFSRLHFINEAFPEELKAVVDRYRLPAGLLELEITESVAMEKIEDISRYIERLRSYGFRIAIDDFGVGYSSLSVLDQIPIDVLKLDRNFFLKGADDNVGCAVIRCLVVLAHTIGIEIVCEGIETDEQERLLRNMDCRIAQGFKYARPIPAEAFRTLLREHAGAGLEGA